MQTITTDRLLLRPFTDEDAMALFEMDSNAEVHRYLGNQPVKSIEEIIRVVDYIQQQYRDFGIGRWVVADKETGNFMGWAGLKWITEAINDQLHYYDLGYRFMPQFCGCGYATEAGNAWVKYATNELRQEKIYAMTHSQNLASQNVLGKLGFATKQNFVHEGTNHLWLEKYLTDY
ncbi:MAG TPA: GNAT family N-acetyltransferase [Saprospiraceae bacterium]|nr:GNAT family N-acetyltransferase [Saprospiraceae bacterium]HRG64293.1 GNAT family N-acetyltransferase [Saprospiraceae bacterium]